MINPLTPRIDCIDDKISWVQNATKTYNQKKKKCWQSALMAERLGDQVINPLTPRIERQFRRQNEPGPAYKNLFALNQKEGRKMREPGD